MWWTLFQSQLQPPGRQHFKRVSKTAFQTISSASDQLRPMRRDIDHFFTLFETREPSVISLWTKKLHETAHFWITRRNFVYCNSLIRFYIWGVMNGKKTIFSCGRTACSERQNIKGKEFWTFHIYRESGNILVQTPKRDITCFVVMSRPYSS